MGLLRTPPVSTNFLHGPGPHAQGGLRPALALAVAPWPGVCGQGGDAGHCGPCPPAAGAGRPRASRPVPPPLTETRRGRPSVHDVDADLRDRKPLEQACPPPCPLRPEAARWEEPLLLSFLSLQRKSGPHMALAVPGGVPVFP